MGMGGRRWALALVFAGLLGCHDPSQLQSVEAYAQIDEPLVDFGQVPVGEWRELVVHVRNVGAVPFHAIDALRLVNDPSFVVVLDGGGKIQPGDAREVHVRFHPLHEGEITDTVRVRTDAEHRPPGLVPIKGVGAPTPIQVSTQTLDYQTLEIDSDRTLSVTITNPVDLPLTINLDGASANQFTPAAVLIPPKESLTLATTYAPHINGASAASLQIRSCDGCTPTQVALVGNAVPSAFVFDPAPVPFDDIPVHETTRSRTTLKNITWRPVTISTTNTSDVAFKTLTNLNNHTVNPGDGVQMDLEFDARTSGPWIGTMGVDYQSDKARNTGVVLDARGGRPQLALTPVSIDFGDLVVGAKVERTVRLANAGTNGNLTFQGVSATGDTDDFGVEAPARDKVSYPWTGGAWPNLTDSVPIAPSPDYLDVKVAFAPTAEGQFNATINFNSDDMFSPSRPVTVTGHGHVSGPCTFELDPQPSLEFGNVPTGSGAVLGFRFVNTGTNECGVKDIHLSQDANGAFFMPGGALPGGSVIPGSAFSAQIAFKAPADGVYAGELSITVNNPTTPVVKLPIHAWAQASCLVAAPNFLDFGAIRYDCDPGTRFVLVSNQCPYPVTLDNTWIGTGTSNQFSFLQTPALPSVLQPAQGVQAELAYSRTVLGQHYSPLFFHAAGEPQPLLVPLLAETNHSDSDVEHFTQGTDNQLDVLFVVSNTTTMQSYQNRLGSVVPNWLADAKAKGIDLHVGVTTTGLVPSSSICPGGVQGGEAGRLFPVDQSGPRVLTWTTPNEAGALQSNLQVGVCHNLVQGLEAARAALSSPLVDHADDPSTQQPNDGNLGFFRRSARLAVVALSDEDDHSGFDPQSYVQFLQALKGPGMAQRTALYALVPTDNSCVTAGPAGPRFSSVATGTGGEVRSICSDANGYAGMLGDITGKAAGLQKDFHLAHTPSDPGAITVFVDGAQVTNWHYDAGSNSILFDAAPNPGQDIAVHYHAVCGP
jgi:hypothetical protein